MWQSASLLWAVIFVLATGLPLPRVARSDDAISTRATEFLAETIRQADEIADAKIRTAAQWRMVYALIQVGKPHDAIDQARKLATTNPHTCILSLISIGKDAVKRNDTAMVELTFQTAADVNRQTGSKYTHKVVDMGFKLDRPLESIIEIADPNNQQGQALGGVRNWLARKGRVDEAYQIARKHMSNVSELHHHRQIGYSCATVKHYDYYAKHDYFGQTIEVINKMPLGKERDFVILSLVNNLTYTANKDTVSDEHMKLAAHWANQIQNDVQRGAAQRKILQRKPLESVEQLEKRFAAAELREEKEELLSRIFRSLIAAENLDEADKILPRQLQLIKEQPRPEQISAFGVFNDNKATKYTTWLHERSMVEALIKAGKIQDAKNRVQAMADLPDDQPIMFVGNLADIRQKLMLELGEFDDLKRSFDETNPGQPHAYHLYVTQHLVKQGALEQAIKEISPVLSQPQDVVFEPKKINHFSATVHRELSDALVQSDNVAVAVRVLAQIPEHQYLTEPFKSFGRTICDDRELGNLEPWLEKLPHATARVYARLGAWQGTTTRENSK